MSSSGASVIWKTQANYLPAFTDIADVSCSSTTHCVIVGATKESETPGVAVGSGSSWTRGTIPSGIYQLTGVACPSATVCVAGGSVTGGNGTLIYSTDGGAVWTTATEGSTQWVPQSLSCSSASDCMAVGDSASNSVEITKDGGAAWSNGPEPSGVNQLSAVSCATGGSVCAAVGTISGTAQILWYSGTSWKVTAYAGATGGLAGVACPSSSDCIVVGRGTGAAIATTTDGGTKWNAVTAPSGIDYLYGVSCLSTSECSAAGEDQTANGAIISGSIVTGSFTIATTPSGTASYNDVSCAVGSADCTAAGALTDGAVALAESVTSGSTWTSQSLPLSLTKLGGVSCGSSSTCVAVGTSLAGGTVEVTTNAGTSWTGHTIAGVSAVASVVCFSASDCDAVGAGTATGDLLVSTDGGTSWTPTPLPTTAFNMNTPVALSCRSALECVVIGSTVGGTYETLSTTNGGSTWAATTSSLTEDTLDAISCSSASDCVATGVDESSGLALILDSTNFGTTWTSETVPDTPAEYESLLGVSCPSTSDCVAVGEVNPFSAGSSDTAAFTSSDGGVSWSEHLLTPPQQAALYGVSCFSTSDCTAVGLTESGATTIGAAEATTDGGSTWSSQTEPSASYQLLGDDCVSATNCEAVGLNTSKVGGIIVGSSSGTPPLAITTASFPGGTVGRVYTATAAATGGTSPYTWTRPSGTKPPGLSFSSSGAWSGTPTTAGTYSFTIEVTDKTGTHVSKALEVTIDSPLAITTTSLPSGTVGKAYSTTLKASGGTPPYSWTRPSGTKPPGPSFSGGGVWSGTPTTAGTYSFTIEVTDFVGTHVSKALKIVIAK
jgi:hypothetical protein